MELEDLLLVLEVEVGVDLLANTYVVEIQVEHYLKTVVGAMICASYA